MKKLFYVILACVFACGVLSFAACKDEAPQEKQTVRMILPDGAPALALAALYAGGEATDTDGAVSVKKENVLPGYDFEFTLGQESALAAALASGKADVALLPTNAAAAAYTKGAKIKVVSVNVHGLLYMVGNAPVENLSELVGKVVYSIGEGGTPDYVFKYILSAAGIGFEKSETPVEGKVAITYVEGGAALIPLLKQGQAEYGILGEPAATNACQKAGKVVAFDLQEGWKAATKAVEGEELPLPQASVAVSTALIERDPDFVASLIAKMVEADAWLPENLAAANEAMKALGSATAASTVFTLDMVARCNLKTEEAYLHKAEIMTYLNALYAFKPAAVGGVAPTEELLFAAN